MNRVTLITLSRALIRAQAVLGQQEEHMKDKTLLGAMVRLTLLQGGGIGFVPS